MSDVIHILCIEDDTSLAQLFRQRLGEDGYSVDLARDGEEGLATAQTGSYDVLIVEQTLPVYTGLDVIRSLATRNLLPPTIIITETGLENIVVEAFKLGASDYLIKDDRANFLELLPPVVRHVLYQQRLAGEKAQAVEALQWRTRELALLKLAGRELGSSLDLDQVLATVLGEVRRLMGAIACTVWLTDFQTGELVCRQNAGPHDAILRNWRLAPDQGVVGWVARHGQSLIVDDTRLDPRHFKDVDLRTGVELRSLLNVPLCTKQAVIGVLQVVDTSVGRFDTSDLTLMESLAASAASAIENARLYEHAQQEIAERKQAQETLRQRTLELQARNEELDAFAHSVAHDLKSVVGQIVGFALILEEDYAKMPGQELGKYLHAIGQYGLRMSNIIDELLLLAGVRKQEVQIGPLDMASILPKALERLDGLIKERQTNIVLPQRWPVAWGYGPWIEEVWVNYISNAIKYGGRPPRVELGADVLAGQAGASPAVRFWVRDNGAGLTAEEQARLFVPFTQLNQVAIEGYGLGLSIVRRIIEKLGGQVRVESTVGQGSTFSFTLAGPAT